MKTLFGFRFRFRFCLFVLLLVLWFGVTASAQMDLKDARGSDADAPLQFTSNGYVLGFSPHDVSIAGGEHALRVEFVNAAPTVPIADAVWNNPGSVEPLSHITYPSLWDGISLIYDAPSTTILRSTYKIEPFANVAQIRLCYSAPVQVESDGSLAIQYPTGVMRETAPIAWQERDGRRENVGIVFQVRNEREIGFSAGVYDVTRPLWIDPTLTWHTFLGGTGTDEGFSTAADTAGNVYVTGWSNASWGSPIRAYSGGVYDGFVAKLDNTGNLAWNTFLGAGAADRGYGIAVDSSGFVYVIGWSGSTWGSPIRGFSGGEADAFIAKLDGTGNLLWNTFLGGGGYDWGQSLTLDGNGNIFAIGHSFSTWGSPIRAHSNSRWDAYVAKLDSSGNLSWHTFLGGSMDDNGSALFVDVSGNVFAAGTSSNSWGSPVGTFSGGGDAFVAKLDGSGNLTWHSFVGGSGADSGTGITGDSSGNLYLAGWSSADWGSPIRPYTGSDDALAAKLDSSGNLTWHTFLGSSSGDAASAIRVGNNAVWVVGWSDAAWGSPDRAYTAAKDTFIARLTENGGLGWLSFFGGGGDDWSAFNIGLDGIGNVYLGGYGPDWGSPLNGYAGGASDAFVIKIAKNETQPQACPGTWRTFVGSASEYDESRAITLDADCNVYVVGNSNASWGSPVDAYTGSTDAFVAKFNSGGVLQWNTFMGSSGVFDHGAGIAVDANGNVYVTGISIGASWGSPIDPFAGGFQAFVTKLNSSGVRQWNTFLGGPGESGDGYGIAVDGLGNVYVTGESRSDWGSSPIESYHGGREIFVAKLNTNGIRQWHTFLGSGAKDSGFDIALDDSGSIYVTAWSQGDFGSPRNPYAGDSDVAIVKLNSDGTRAWNTFMGSAGTDYGWGVAPDSNGNVYVSGYSDGTWGSPVTGNAGGWDGFAAKLNSSGDRQWNTFFGSTAEDQGFRMSIDGNGNTFVTGFSYETWGSPLSAFAGPRDAFLVKINSNGERIWNTFIGTAADDLGNDVAVDANGGAFVTGYSQSRWESGLKPEADESDGFITKLGATPTAATLTSFAARAANNRVVVKWATGSELQVIGFNVWRREANQSEFQKLNAALISAQNPGSVIGNSYSYNDLRVQGGTTYRYKLEIVETIGGSEWSGVVKVNVAEACAAAPDTPHLTTPRDGATVKQTRVKLKWETAPCAATYRVILRQSSPDGKKVDQATGLTKPQYKTIELQAGKTYYWHVRACNAKGCSEWSQWRTFNVPKGATSKSE